MENVLLPTKKRKTTHGQKPIYSGYDIEPTLKRKNHSKKKKKKKTTNYRSDDKEEGLIPMADTIRFLKGEYCGAFHTYFQKRGVNVNISYETGEHKANKPKGKKVYVSECEAIFSVSAQAVTKKQAINDAALAMMKSMELIPEGAEDPNRDGVWQLRALSGPKVIVVKKKKEELWAEREIDKEQKIYCGTVKFYSPRRKFGIISLEEDITFKDATAERNIFAAKDDIVCCSDRSGMNNAAKVVFKIYNDSLGIGAYEVKNEDGTPIFYDPKPKPKKIEDAKLGGNKLSEAETDAKPKTKDEKKDDAAAVGGTQ